jgi:hypothetical protein
MSTDSSYEDKELAILRRAVDAAEQRSGRKVANSPEIQEIITIVEGFLRKKKLICYGGTAINNILPTEDQFYDKSVEIPDYDFFSNNALNDAKELADIYANKGFDEVEAKSGVHKGTFKVFVNYIPVADITQLDIELYRNIKRDAISVAGILYTPPNYLRMSMYLELSRPDGDVSRWEKVLKRLTLLNKNYPLQGYKCNEQNFQRSMGDDETEVQDIYNVVKTSFINQGVVFFGGFANTLYSKYMPRKLRKQLQNIPDFDVLSENPHTCVTIVKERLMDAGVKRIKIIKHPGLGEVIAPHYEIKVGSETIAFVYEPLACHSYNVIHLKRNAIKIATIDTMLSFYLAFLYSDRPYYDDDRILCMAQFLFKVQQKNRLQQKGLLRRFSINCYGKQETLEDNRYKKAEMYKKLKNKRGTKEYEEWFLKYSPTSQKLDKEEKPKKQQYKKKPKTRRKGRGKKKKGKTKRVRFNFGSIEI